MLTKVLEIQRITKALREKWKVEKIAPGHCTGEPAFLALSEAFEGQYIYAGLGDTIDLP